MKLLNISVPKPCHENWEIMSLEEKGRFCSVCSKTVLDFTTKSKEEVLDYVANHANEKMCGRFRNDQLQPTPPKIEIPLSVVYRKASSLQAFAIALLIVFGSSLFSCTNPDSPVLGKMILTNDLPKGIIESKIDSSVTTGDTVITHCTAMGEVLGNFKSIPIKDFPIDSAATAVIETNPVDTFNLPAVDITESKIPLVCFTTGLMIAEVKAVENPIDTNEIVNTSKQEIVNNDPIAESIYPNPTTGHITINLNLKSKQKVQIDLFSLDGKLIRTLIPLQIFDPSEYSLELDISDQPPAIYLLRSIIDGNLKTDRVELIK